MSSWNRKSKEEKIMCDGKSEGSRELLSHCGILVDRGTVWYMSGRQLVIDRPLLHYCNKSMDVDTKYLSFQFSDDKSWNICSYSMFASSAKTEEPRVPRVVTPDQIMLAKPCEDGARFLYRYLGMRYSSDPYLNGANLAASGKRSLACSVQGIYDYYCGHGHMPDSWLLFVAKVLNLVPQESAGPDRETLKRLLGIK